jgi:glycosyltransferase involved in cell wall biosynthesis
MQLAALAARPRGVPVVLHLHDYVSQRKVMSRVFRLVRPRRVTAAAISRSVADDARLVLGRRIPVRVVYNGLDVEHWRPDGGSSDLDALSGIPPAPPGTVRVGLVATMARWKGHEVFLHALALLPRGIPVRAYVIGGSIYATDGSQYDLSELRALAARLGLADVGFTGFVRDPAAAMRALDIVVHASTRPEPFGRVIVEGMAVARAVIVSSAGGASELFEPGESAIAFAVGDAAGLADRIAQLAGHPTRRRSLGERGAEHVRARFTRAGMADTIRSVYRSALEPVTS